jgi:hypothetical protein
MADTPTTILSGVKITDGGHFMLPGHALWKLRGQPVWAGSLRQPVEDLAYDEIVLHWTDIAKIEGEAWYGQA